MNGHVGLWIDRRKAVIVTINHPQDGMRRIQAELEKRVYFSESSSWRDQDPTLRDKQFDHSFSNYYDDITTQIHDAESIQIFGPGDAKFNLEKCLKREKLDKRIVGIEDVDKMTDRQIEAKVWKHFLSMI